MPYTTRPPKSYTVIESRDGLSATGDEVFDDGPQFTGLYDRYSQEIWRAPEPIGFRLKNTPKLGPPPGYGASALIRGAP